MLHNIWTTIIAVLVAAGVPSGVFGVLIWKLEKKMDKIETARETKEKAKIDHEVMLIEMTMASLELAEVTAEAVQRIPDANCNGEMTAALQGSKDVKNKYRNFERYQVVTVLESK